MKGKKTRKNEKKIKKMKKNNLKKYGKPEKKGAGNPVAHARTQGFNITNILYYYYSKNKARECTSGSQLSVKRPY